MRILDMVLWLKAHICAAVRGADLVLLDTEAGAYGAVPGLGGRVRMDAAGRVEPLEPGLDAVLREAGLVADLPGPPRRPPPALPDQDLGAQLRAAPDPAALVAMVLSGLDMVGAYWAPGFPELVRRARARQAAPLRTAAPAELARLALQFRDLLPFVPFQGECLFRSVMLQAFLRRRGLGSTLVLGCQTWPFEAHCWVQVEDLVLDDGVDHVRGFTPLLAI